MVKYIISWMTNGMTSIFFNCKWRNFRLIKNLPKNDSPPVNSPSISISNNSELVNGYLGIPKKGDLSEDLSKKLKHGYYSTVSYVDHLVGKIIITLEEEELLENTIIIFVSDHGFNLKEHSQ